MMIRYIYKQVTLKDGNMTKGATRSLRLLFMCRRGTTGCSQDSDHRFPGSPHDYDEYLARSTQAIRTGPWLAVT